MNKKNITTAKIDKQEYGKDHAYLSDAFLCFIVFFYKSVKTGKSER